MSLRSSRSLAIAVLGSLWIHSAFSESHQDVGRRAKIVRGLQTLTTWPEKPSPRPRWDWESEPETEKFDYLSIRQDGTEEGGSTRGGTEPGVEYEAGEAGEQQDERPLLTGQEGETTEPAEQEDPDKAGPSGLSGTDPSELYNPEGLAQMGDEARARGVPASVIASALRQKLRNLGRFSMTSSRRTGVSRGRGGDGEETIPLAGVDGLPMSSDKFDGVERNSKQVEAMWCQWPHNLENFRPKKFDMDGVEYWNKPGLDQLRPEVYEHSLLKLCGANRNSRHLLMTVGCICKVSDPLKPLARFLHCPAPDPQFDPVTGQKRIQYVLWETFEKPCRQFCGCDDMKENPILEVWDKLKKNLRPTETSTEPTQTATATTTATNKASLPDTANGMYFVWNGHWFRPDALVRKGKKSYGKQTKEDIQGQHDLAIVECVVATKTNYEECKARVGPMYGNAYEAILPTAKCGVSCTNNNDCLTQSGDRGCRCIASPTFDEKRAAGLDPIGWSSAVCLGLSAVVAATRPSLSKLNGRDVSPDVGPRDIVIREPACPCNTSYVSRGCCDSDDGMIWEPRFKKMGVMDL